jgi:hypothetical protein
VVPGLEPAVGVNLINPLHRTMRSVKIQSIESYRFDPRHFWSTGKEAHLLTVA